MNCSKLFSYHCFKACDCPEISFGSVDEVMEWHGNPVIYHCITSCKMKAVKVCETISNMTLLVLTMLRNDL